MKRLLITAAIFAASLAANSAQYTNVTVKVNGTNRVYRARLVMPDFKALEKAHGREIGVEKDPIRGEITWVFEDGHRESRMFPPKLVNNPTLFSAINRKHILEMEERKKGAKK